MYINIIIHRTRIYLLSDLPKLGSHKKAAQIYHPHRLSVRCWGSVNEEGRMLESGSSQGVTDHNVTIIMMIKLGDAVDPASHGY